MPNFLEQSEIGALNLILAYSLILGQIGTLGFHNTTIRIFPYFKDPKTKHHGFILLILLVSLAGIILIALVYYIMKPWLINRNADSSPIFVQYLYLILPVTIFTIIFNQFDAQTRALYYSTTGTFIKEFVQRLLILLIVLLFIGQIIDQTGLFVLYSVALSVPAILILAFLILKREFVLTSDFGFLDRPMLIDMVRMSGFGIMTGFGVLAIANIDRLMINFYLSEGHTGIYSVTFYFGALIIMPARAVQRIAASMIATAFKENDLESIKKMYHQTCLYQLMLALLLFLLLWVNIDEVLTLIPSEYLIGKYVIFFIGLANVVLMAGGTSASIISSSRYYAYSAWFVGIYLFLIILTNIFFIPAFGIIGAAAASALSTLLYMILQFVFVYKKWGFQPYNLSFIWITLIAIAVYIVVSLIPELGNIFLDMIIQSTVLIILFILMVYKMNISKNVNQMIDNIFSNLWKNK